jgi:hypothetical protein
MIYYRIESAQMYTSVSVKLKYPFTKLVNGGSVEMEKLENLNPRGAGSEAGEGAFPPTPNETAQQIRKELDRKLKELNIELNEKLRKNIEQYAIDWASEQIELELEEEEEPFPVEGFVIEAVEVALEEFGVAKEDEEEEEW